MSGEVKWGVLGTARIAVEQVIPAIRRSGNGVVHAVASMSGKGRNVAKSLDIPRYYDSYEELLQDPAIDAVYIPLPNNMHAEWTIRAARAGKHVLCEKPAALNAKDAEEMISACRENGVLFMEAFMYRFHPQQQKVKELIGRGVIGDVKMMRASFTYYMEDREGNIRLNPELGGGAVYDVGCYCINAMLSLLGSEPLSVTAEGEWNGDGVDTAAGALLRFPGQVIAMFDCGFDAAMRHGYEVVGTRGTIHVPFAFRPDVHGGIGVVRVNGQDETTEYEIFGDQYRLEVEHFADCILNGTAPEYAGEKIVANLKVIEAVYHSMRNNETVILS